MKNSKANLSIALISIIVSVLLWGIIMNIINPVVNGFVNVTLEVENENYVTEQNKTYTILGSKNIRISYKVKNENQTNIKQSDFRVYIDLNDLAYTNDLSVNYKVLNGIDDIISNVELYPKTVTVNIDDAIRNEYTILYDLMGNIPPGRSVGNVILSPAVIYVTGGNTTINNIDHVSIDIPVANREETFSGTAKPKVYAVDGSIISSDNIELSADSISYSVLLHSRANITLNPVVEGNVGTGYTYAGVQVYPNTIMIEGPRSVIENIYNIDLPVINIEGLTSNKEITYLMSEILPMGITSSTSFVTVNVTVNSNIISGSVGNIIGPHNEEIEETIDGKVDTSNTEYYEAQETMEEVENSSN